MTRATELAVDRCFEVILNIPTGIIQVYSFLTRPYLRTARLMMSIAISCFCAAFSVSVHAYDFDTSPKKRRRDGTFYGYIPDHGREIVFLLMTITSTVHTFMRIFSFALAWDEYSSWFLVAAVSDYALFLCIKLIRADFMYMHERALLKGGRGVFISLLERTFAKLVLDFTGNFHLRHPKELGGTYWAYSLISTLASSWVIAWVYISSTEESGGGA